MYLLQIADLLNELSDTENEIKLSFSVMMYDAKEGDIVPVGVGVMVGDTTLWAAMANISVTAGSAAAPGTATYSVSHYKGTSFGRS